MPGAASQPTADSRPRLNRQARKLIAQIRRDPKDEGAIRALRTHYAATEDYPSLANLLEGWATRTADGRLSSQRFVDAAEAAMLGAGDRLRAAYLLERALQRTPLKADLLDRLGALLEAERAKEPLKHALQRHVQRLADEPSAGPGLRADADFRLARVYELALNRPDKAMLHYRRALEHDPKHLPSLGAARDLYLEAGNHQAAALLWEMQISAVPSVEQQVALLLELAGLQERFMDEPAQAMVTLRRVLRRVPDHAVAMGLLAGMLERRYELSGDPDDAERAVQLRQQLESRQAAIVPAADTAAIVPAADTAAIVPAADTAAIVPAADHPPADRGPEERSARSNDAADNRHGRTPRTADSAIAAKRTPAEPPDAAVPQKSQRQANAAAAATGSQQSERAQPPGSDRRVPSPVKTASTANPEPAYATNAARAAQTHAREDDTEELPLPGDVGDSAVALTIEPDTELPTPSAVSPGAEGSAHPHSPAGRRAAQAPHAEQSPAPRSTIPGPVSSPAVDAWLHTDALEPLATSTSPLEPIAEDRSEAPPALQPLPHDRMTKTLGDHANHEPIEVNLGPTTASNLYIGIEGGLLEGGVFAATYADLAIGTPVALTLTLPGGLTAHALGRVRFRHDVLDFSDDQEPGLAVEFEQVTPADLELIARFANQRPPMFYDS